MLTILLITASLTVTAADTSVNDCQKNIYGCVTCLEKSKNAIPYYSCQVCQPDLYLYKRTITSGSAAGESHNICVPNCIETDSRTFPDEVNKQCIYLGPYCSVPGLIKSSLSQKMRPTCHYSNFRDGYVKAKRGNSLQSMLTKTTLDSGKYRVSSLEGLRNLTHVYFPPLVSEYSSQSITV